MDKINVRKYCDKVYKSQIDPFFRLCVHGKAFFCGIAYPTEDSRSYAACEKALEIGSSSFLRRPSLCDEAVNTIAGFINEGLYALQDPGKPFFCNLAIIYGFRGKARWMVSGESVIYHFQDSRLIRQSAVCREPLLGKYVCWKETLEPEFDVSHSTNAFLLYSGTQQPIFPNQVTGVNDILPSIDGDVWMENVLSVFQGKACSVAAFVLPTRKRKLLWRNER